MSEKQEDLQHLKKLIAKLRGLGKSYEELGAKTGVSSTTILRIDKDEANPREETVKNVTEALENLLSEERESLMEGFTSPFTGHPEDSKEKEESLEKRFQKTKDLLTNILRDDSVPEKYKKSLINIIWNDIDSFESMIDQDE